MPDSNFNHFCFNRIKQLIRRDIEIWTTSLFYFAGELFFFAILFGIVIVTDSWDDKTAGRDGLRAFTGITMISSLIQLGVLLPYFPVLTNDFPYNTIVSKIHLSSLTRKMLPVTPVEVYLVGFFHIAIGIPAIIYITFLVPLKLMAIILTNLAWYNFFTPDLFFLIFYSATSASCVLITALSHSVQRWPYRRTAPFQLTWSINLLLCLLWLIFFFFNFMLLIHFDDLPTYLGGLMAVIAIIFWLISGFIQIKYR